MALRKQADKPAPRINKGPQCTVCIALDALPREDADVLRSWMSDPAWTFQAIAEETDKDEDTPSLGSTAIGRHARGQCNRKERLRVPQ